MDSDSLIKITKAGLKELIVNKVGISIPKVVKREIVDAGKEKGCTDAFVVEKNINSNIVTIVESSSNYSSGDHALIDLYRKEDFYAVATDDLKLTRHLRAYSIPFILPGLIIYQLFKNKKIKMKTALWALQQLAEFVSEDEFSTVRLLMEK